MPISETIQSAFHVFRAPKASAEEMEVFTSAPAFISATLSKSRVSASSSTTSTRIPSSRTADTEADIDGLSRSTSMASLLETGADCLIGSVTVKVAPRSTCPYRKFHPTIKYLYLPTRVLAPSVYEPRQFKSIKLP